MARAAFVAAHLAGLACLLPSAPGLGQRPTATLLGTLSVEARSAIDGAGRCLAESDPVGTHDLLLIESESKAKPVWRALASRYPECVAPDWGLNHSFLILGAAAEQLSVRESAPLTPRLIAAAETKSNKSRMHLDKVAMCVTRRNLDRISALFATQPGSPEEQSVLEELESKSRGCGREGTMTITAFGARAAIAIATYRILVGKG